MTCNCTSVLDLARMQLSIASLRCKTKLTRPSTREVSLFTLEVFEL